MCFYRYKPIRYNMAGDMLMVFMSFLPGTLEILADLAAKYGLIGLFISSFIGSTIFVPFSVELLFPVLIESGVDLYPIIFVASTGALIGTWVNYWLGYKGSSLVKRRFGEKGIEKAKNAMDKYGWPGLFLVVFLPIPLPIPVDPLTIIPGIARMNFLRFSVVVYVAKLLRYAFFVGVLNGLLSMFFPHKPIF